MTKLEELVRAAVDRYAALTPEQKRAHDEAQRQSFARSMLPSGHDMTREQIEARIAELDQKIAEAPGWGAAVGEMAEERTELLGSLSRLR